MDYFDVLKKAWKITWKYKMLWVLGLFAGAGSSGSSGGSSNYSSGSSDYGSGGADAFAGMERWFTENLALVAVIVGLLAVIGFVWWILSIAAQGGLVHGANEAAEGRTPSLKESWSVGFSRWGRTFMTAFVVGLPMMVVILAFVIVFVVMIGGGAALNDEAALGAALAGGLCLVLPVFLVLIVAIAIITGIVYQLALRYGVLDDITFGQAIKRGWDDLRAKRGAFVMSLVMILPGFAASMVMFAFALPFMIPAIAFIIAEKFVMAGAMFVVMALAMLLPTAVYGTFVSSSWTVFFRRMTGREPSGVPAPAPAYAYAPVPPTIDVPVPPVAPQPEPAPAEAVPQAEPAPVIEEPEAPTADAGFGQPAEEAPPADA